MLLCGAMTPMASMTPPAYPLRVRSTLKKKTTMKTFLMPLHDGKSGFSSATPQGTSTSNTPSSFMATRMIKGAS